MIDRIEAKFPDSYRNGNVLMIHGDCMDVMEEIGENEIPLAIVDPPYGIGVDGKNIIANPSDASNFKFQSRSHDWDAYTPDEKYFNELARVSKNQIIWGGELFS